MTNQFLAWLGTIALGLTGLGIVIKKYLPGILKAIQLSRDVLDLVDDFVKASEDNKLTPEEIQKFVDNITEIQKDLKGEAK